MTSANYSLVCCCLFSFYLSFFSFFHPWSLIAFEGGGGEGGGQSLGPRVEKSGRCMGGRKNVGSVNGKREK